MRIAEYKAGNPQEAEATRGQTECERGCHGALLWTATQIKQPQTLVIAAAWEKCRELPKVENSNLAQPKNC